MVLSNAVPLLNQRVGANSQFSGGTNGTAGQWNFYLYTNTLATNTIRHFHQRGVCDVPAAQPGLPRMGASTEVAPPNQDATRFAGADIDLYVSTNPGVDQS